MSRIQRLSTNLINKIAAGEVIERPGSVVKELMENSIDAGSTRIDVVIDKGGSELIRIVDNGCGMDADDLILAITSHATSKLTNEEDLFNVSTMGFRGEAMASVAEISQMTVRSRVNPGVKPTVGEPASGSTLDNIGGLELRAEGGVYQEPIPCGCPPGTQIDVKNLFFNTPVRRKFLKSVQTEFGYITEYFTRLALANPQIHFTLRHNSRMVYDLPVVADWLQRICDIEGKELADSLLYVEQESAGVRVYGYAARPSHSRSNAKMQFLFLNGRPIRDRALQHALLEAYRGLITQNRFPICFLMLEMPPKMVDVNVHPTKMEVRFQDSNRIYSQFLATLRSKFLTTNMSTYVNAVRSEDDVLVPLTETFRNIDAPEKEDMETNEYENLSTNPSGSEASAKTQNVPTGSASTERESVLSWLTESTRKSSSPMSETVPPFRPFQDDAPSVSRAQPRSTGATDISGNASNSQFGARPRQTTYNQRTQQPNSDSQEQYATHFSNNIIQIHNRYIVTQCDEGLMVIDQHAMHERILYERLKNRMRSMSVEVQRLLTPEPIDLRPSEAAMLLERRKHLEEMGLQIEPFGGSTILVHTVPAMLYTFEKKDRLRVDELLREILEAIQNGGGELTLEKFIDDTLHTIACKAACKAGQPLTFEEMRKLLDEYQNCPVADHCPHGRPSVLIWSCQELDKLFCRIL